MENAAEGHNLAELQIIAADAGKHRRGHHDPEYCPPKGEKTACQGQF